VVFKKGSGTVVRSTLGAVSATVPDPFLNHAEVRVQIAALFTPARDAAALKDTVQQAFEKLGDTRLVLGNLTYHNPDDCFVPVSRLNQLRRELTSKLEQNLEEARARRVQRVLSDLTHLPEQTARPGLFRWSLKVDRVGCLAALTEEDWSDLDELTIDIARDHPASLHENLDLWAARLGRERIRLALPALTRKWEEHGLLLKIAKLRAEGWNRWEAGNLSAWSFLGIDSSGQHPTLDLATDWSVYVLNRLAARQLLDMGVSRFALSPEDGLANYRGLLREFGSRAVVIVYQDTPLFLAESCAYANLIGGCPGKANCRFESMAMVSQHGERVTALDYHCRTIVLNDGPFCLSPHLKDLSESGAISLRADFIYRTYQPQELRERWRAIRAGRRVPGGHAANFNRGLL
jgi:putative protease